MIGEKYGRLIVLASARQRTACAAHASIRHGQI